MTRKRYRFPLIFVPTFFCILGIIWLYQNHMLLVGDAFGFWLVFVLVMTGVLLGSFPPSMFRRIGRVAGHVKRAIVPRLYPHKASVHEDKQPYEQGYRVNSSNVVQTVPVSPDEYELPQAQYPQQQLPPM